MFPILLGDLKNYQRPDHAERTWGPKLFDRWQTFFLEDSDVFGTDFAQAVAE
jgi:hypothetical protein